MNEPAHSLTSATSTGQSKLHGRLCILAACLLWSSNGLFVKSNVFSDWPDGERGMLLAFWRALFAGVLMIPAVRRPRLQWRLLPMVLAFTGMNILFLQSMTLTTAANAIWLQSTAPLWVFVLGLWIGREGFDSRDVIPLVCGGLGAGLILFFEMRNHPPTGIQGWGVPAGLGAGVFYALVILGMRGLREENSVWLVTANHLTAALLLAPIVLSWGIWPSGKQLLVLAAFGFFQMGLPYTLFARGLRSVSSQEGVGISLLEPLLVPIWVMLCYGEWPAPWTVAGGAFILVGLVMRYRRGS